MKRCEVRNEDKWDLTDIYESYDIWEKEVEKLPELVTVLDKYKGHLLDSADTLYNYYKEAEEIECLLERMHFYAFLVIDEDLTNDRAAKNLGIIEDYIAKYNSATSFVVPEIIKSDYSVIECFIKEDKRLEEYERMFKEMFRVKKHMLNDKEEALFNEVENIAESFRTSSQFIRDTEMDFGYIKDEDGNDVKLTASNVLKYSRSNDRSVRKSVYENETKAYERHIKSLATNYIGYIKTYELEAKKRGYESFLEQKLDDRNIPRSVYESLKKVAKSKKNVYQKYLKMIQKCLGVEKLESYDLAAPFVKKSNREYTIDEAKEMILDTYSFYGSEYTDILKYAFDSRKIDFMPSDNKVTGWYSAYIPYAKPRILGNYNGKILDVSSICHELGHFVNQYMIIENQPSQYVYQTSFCAEVASLNNEIVFTFKQLEKETDKEIRKELLANFLKVFSSNFFGAIRQALFEEEAHTLVASGKGASAADFSDIQKKINDEFNGEVLEATSSIGWACVPHFFLNSGYYVFNYSTGVVAACNLAHKLLTDEEGIKEKFLEYLKIGCSMDPIDSLKVVGIDMTSEEPYKVAIQMFEEKIDEFNKLMD